MRKPQERMASKPINIWWMRTGSQKSSIASNYEYPNKNHEINTSLVHGPLAPLGHQNWFNLII